MESKGPRVFFVTQKKIQKVKCKAQPLVVCFFFERSFFSTRKKKHTRNSTNWLLGGGFKYFIFSHFSPYRGKWSKMTHIFANGLKPPIRKILRLRHLFSFSTLDLLKGRYVKAPPPDAGEKPTSRVVGTGHKPSSNPHGKEWQTFSPSWSWWPWRPMCQFSSKGLILGKIIPVSKFPKDRGCSAL